MPWGPASVSPADQSQLGLHTSSVLRSLSLPFRRELVIASRTHPDDPGWRPFPVQSYSQVLGIWMWVSWGPLVRPTTEYLTRASHHSPCGAGSPKSYFVSCCFVPFKSPQICYGPARFFKVLSMQITLPPSLPPSQAEDSHQHLRLLLSSPNQSLLQSLLPPLQCHLSWTPPEVTCEYAFWHLYGLSSTTICMPFVSC